MLELSNMNASEAVKNIVIMIDRLWIPPNNS